MIGNILVGDRGVASEEEEDDFAVGPVSCAEKKSLLLVSSSFALRPLLLVPLRLLDGRLVFMHSSRSNDRSIDISRDKRCTVEWIVRVSGEERRRTDWEEG